jgi:hypothetical protein
MAKQFDNYRDVYWPGAWLIKERRIAGVPDIPYNRTLLIQQLTEDAPAEPEFVDECRTLGDVFAHFKPSKEVQFEDEGGIPVQEVLQFRKLTDFGKDGIINQSSMLQRVQEKQEMHKDFIKRLRSVTILQKLLMDPEAKALYLEAIQAFMDELDAAES